MPKLDVTRFPVTSVLFPIEENVKVLVQSQSPAGSSRGHIVLVHGLEGSGEGPYMKSMAQASLEGGYAVHRFNLRSCGGTEEYCPALYHAGLTADLLAFLRHLRSTTPLPLFLAGYSLGGNVVLKLAGELGGEGPALLSGICAVSTPIDLEVCAQRLGESANWLYEWNFLLRMKRRLRRKLALRPGLLAVDGLRRVRSIVEIDDRFTAPLSGFRDAHHYYSTQSANQFIAFIRIPTLIIHAKDDPLIPVSVLDCPAVRDNSLVQLRLVDHGGHMGFIARDKPRYWLDRELLAWFDSLLR